MSQPTTEPSITREQLAEALNADLCREYQAIIAYVNYSQVLNGAQYMTIASTLETHASEELSHAMKISYSVAYLNAMPAVTPVAVKTSKKNEDMLHFDLNNEIETIRQYRRRAIQAKELNETAIATMIDGILYQEQDHMVALAGALGIDCPNPGIAGPEVGAWNSEAK